MKRILLGVTTVAVLGGAAFAQVSPSAHVGATTQVNANSRVYFIDVDPGRYGGPGAQRLTVRLGDEPRALKLGLDEICLQLQASENSQIINARVRAFSPEPHEPTSVRVVAPDISPGTFRSTPWGMLLRVVSDQTEAATPVKAIGTSEAPVCQL